MSRFYGGGEPNITPCTSVRKRVRRRLQVALVYLVLTCPGVDHVSRFLRFETWNFVSTSQFQCFSEIYDRLLRSQIAQFQTGIGSCKNPSKYLK